MESKNVRTNTLVMLLMLLLAGQASASFKSCFEPCAVGCFLGKDKFKCALKCLITCVIDFKSSNSTATGLDYCKLGCAVHQCARFGSGTYFFLNFPLIYVCAMQNNTKHVTCIQYDLLYTYSIYISEQYLIY